MTNAQKIALRLSEVRQRLNEIAGLEGDDFTDEVRAEADKLQTEYRDLETRHRAALVAEGTEENEIRGRFAGGGDGGDGESAERARLLRETNIADYLGPAASGSGIEGRARELNAALEVPVAGVGGGVAVPWDMLESRAFTTTTNNDGSEVQRPILQRLFGPGVSDALGVRFDSVPVGRTEWPLITGGVAPALAKETVAAADAVAGTFAFANLKPKRLTGRYEFTHEMAASVSAIEEALRRDLADAVRSSMDGLIVNGAVPSAQDPQNVTGFLTRIAGSDYGEGEADAGLYGRLHAEAVDGIHASMESEVMSVIGDDTYRHAAGVYITGSGESGSELLMRRSGGCVASTYVPDMVGNKQKAILHAAGPNGGGAMRGDSVAAVWPTLEVIRDPYTQASQGVVLTWVTLWDAYTAFRAGAYQVRNVQIAS